jgi:hypothetical protein
VRRREANENEPDPAGPGSLVGRESYVSSPSP